jgi:hypothetical protein
MLDWLGGQFDPAHFDPREINVKLRGLKNLARPIPIFDILSFKRHKGKAWPFPATAGRTVRLTGGFMSRIDIARISAVARPAVLIHVRLE